MYGFLEMFDDSFEFQPIPKFSFVIIFLDVES